MALRKPIVYRAKAAAASMANPLIAAVPIAPPVTVGGLSGFVVDSSGGTTVAVGEVVGGLVGPPVTLEVSTSLHSSLVAGSTSSAIEVS